MAYKQNDLLMTGPDKIKGDCFGSIGFFIFGEGKRTSIQNWGTGGQSGGTQSEHCFAKGIPICTSQHLNL